MSSQPHPAGQVPAPAYLDAARARARAGVIASGDPDRIERYATSLAKQAWFRAVVESVWALRQPEVDRVTAERDRLAVEAEAHEGELGDLRAELSAAEADLDECRDRDAIKGRIHPVLHDLYVRIVGLDKGDCHCNLIAEFVAAALTGVAETRPTGEAPDPRVLTWDWRQQPDLADLAAAIRDLSGGTVLLHEVATGSDESAVVLARGLDEQGATKAYQRHIGMEEVAGG